ncbi:S8 family peptidase [Streptomyces sp. NEAU-Y11]|uniref:S8 family peptidase n=1 Tax=Streptomyces cucumeris TaxID=2962890 RepID=UPI0020C8D2B9|nr:S8 family serine peptidase [Streptomyces sp. NEAU-Y11]MCP9210849.1 S8 family serine peptidase [Streptomyces sp. NEAU-Y11]
MSVRNIATAVTAAALGTLLATLPATPAAAAPVPTPTSWESQALGLPAAQRIAQGEGITVAVLDSGVMTDHPALRGKVTTGPDFYKDGLKPGDPRWGRHGTAMASDVLKVAPKADILSVRVLDDKHDRGLDEGPSGPSPVGQGIDYAVDHGADVISMSLGGEMWGASYDDTEVNALARAAQKGIPVVASAGNEGDSFNEASYPAGYPGVIAVAALQKGGTRAEFSTVRTYNTVAAPGVEIVSAKHTGGWAASSGTSPAAALTSGVVALMLSHNGKLTPAQVRAVLTETATHPPGGRNALVGYGPINAAAAVRAAAKPTADGTAPVKYRGKEFFAEPDGTAKTTHPPLETDLVTIGLGAAGAGLLMLAGAVLITRAGRRRAAAQG